jgi:hypothetical protein
MRDNGSWIEPTVKVIFVVSAVLAIVGLIIGAVVGYHFLAKFW